QYIALSHCWGSNRSFQPPRTTKKTMTEPNVDFNSLTKAFQDTMTLARRLSIPYVWIDSLCIIQDDKDN
ncbi:hypothetical protein B0H67DRAFT_442376, partial [Lasiosphaeris hirsuta]